MRVGQRRIVRRRMMIVRVIMPMFVRMRMIVSGIRVFMIIMLIVVRVNVLAHAGYRLLTSILIVIRKLALDVIEGVQRLAKEIGDMDIVHRIEDLISGTTHLDQANVT